MAVQAVQHFPQAQPVTQGVPILQAQPVQAVPMAQAQPVQAVPMAQP
eukprot:gene14305-4021_t